MLFLTVYTCVLDIAKAEVLQYWTLLTMYQDKER